MTNKINEIQTKIIVKKKKNCGKYCPCPICKILGKLRYKKVKVYKDIAYKQKAKLIVTQGVYKSGCGCSKYFISEIPEAPKGGQFTNEVKEAVIKGIVRDKMSYIKLKQRFEEEFCLKISIGTIFNWFNKMSESPHFFEEFKNWTKTLFSGVLCIDEVYEGKWRIFIATDPLADTPIAFYISERGDQESLDKFLQSLTDQGINPKIIITDGSPLYKQTLFERWEKVEHQLCIFHVLHQFNKLILTMVRTLKNKYALQGNKGRKKKRGRPCKYQNKNKGQSKMKIIAKFIWENQYLLVKNGDKFTSEDHKNLNQLYNISPELKMIRKLVQDFHKLFTRGITQQQARSRRTYLLKKSVYQKLDGFEEIIKLLDIDKFEKMIVFLKYKNVDRTSNHVERTNRAFRMLQKTRYKRRTVRTIENAIKQQWVYYMHHYNYPAVKKKISIIKIKRKKSTANNIKFLKKAA